MIHKLNLNDKSTTYIAITLINDLKSCKQGDQIDDQDIERSEKSKKKSKKRKKKKSNEDDNNISIHSEKV